VSFPSQDRIRVTTQRTVPLFFARVLGLNNQLISATAVAEAAVADSGVQCLKPWAIPLPWVDLEDPPNRLFNPEINEVITPLENIQTGYEMIIKIAEPFNKNGQIDLPSLQQKPTFLRNRIVRRHGCGRLQGPDREQMQGRLLGQQG